MKLGDTRLLNEGFVHNAALSARFPAGFTKDEFLYHEIAQVALASTMISFF